MSEAEIMEEIVRQMGAQLGLKPKERDADDAPPVRKPRKLTAAQRHKQQREAEREEARKRSVSTIYKQLAKVLHPDLEPDPQRRAEKVKLMQELTAANAKGDLHTLLRLELEFIHKVSGDLNHLSEEKLGIYSDLLQVQVRELELESLYYEPRYSPLRAFGIYSINHTNWEQNESLQRCILADARQSLKDLQSGDEAMVKATLHELLKAYIDQQKYGVPF